MAIQEIKDILLEDTHGDLAFASGDFIIADSDSQHIALLLESSRGHWKQFPLTGAGLPEDLAGPLSPQGLQRTIKLALQADGYSNISINISQNSIQVSGKRI